MNAATPLPETRDPLDGIAETLNHAATATLAQMTFGLSPLTFALAFLDWGMHLTTAPGKQLQLEAKAVRKFSRLADYALRAMGQPDAEPAIAPLPQDHRFDDAAWHKPPFSFIAQSFLLNQ